MENINQILERQNAHLRFKDGKVQYFSISTQHSEANTIEEAIKDIVEADKRYDGKSSMRYAIEKYEKEHLLPKYEDVEDIHVSKEEIDNILKSLVESSKKYFGIKK